MDTQRQQQQQASMNRSASSRSITAAAPNGNGTSVTFTPSASAAPMSTGKACVGGDNSAGGAGDAANILKSAAFDGATSGIGATAEASTIPRSKSTATLSQQTRRMGSVASLREQLLGVPTAATGLTMTTSTRSMAARTMASDDEDEVVEVAVEERSNVRGDDTPEVVDMVTDRSVTAADSIVTAVTATPATPTVSTTTTDKSARGYAALLAAWFRRGGSVASTATTVPYPDAVFFTPFESSATSTSTTSGTHHWPIRVLSNVEPSLNALLSPTSGNGTGAVVSSIKRSLSRLAMGASTDVKTITSTSSSTAPLQMLTADELVIMLEKQHALPVPLNLDSPDTHVLIILDLRPLDQHDALTIRGASAISLPPMLQKRYAKGSMQMLDLEQFMVDGGDGGHGGSSIARRACTSPCRKTVVIVDQSLPTTEESFANATSPSLTRGLACLIAAGKVRGWEHVEKVYWLAGGMDGFRARFDGDASSRAYRWLVGSDVVTKKQRDGDDVTVDALQQETDEVLPMRQEVFLPRRTATNRSSVISLDPALLATRLAGGIALPFAPPKATAVAVIEVEDVDPTPQKTAFTTTAATATNTETGPVFLMVDLGPNTSSLASPSEFRYSRINDWLILGPDPAVLLRNAIMPPFHHRIVDVPARDAMSATAITAAAPRRSYDNEALFSQADVPPTPSSPQPMQRLNVTQTAERLRELDVRYVLNLANECPDLGRFLLHDGNERADSDACLDGYHKVGVYDHVEADIEGVILQALPLLDAMHERARTTGGSVYVHCQAGISRSPTVVAAHLMLANGWSCTQALDFLREKRDCVNPNIGFMGALLRLEGLWKSEGRIP